MSMKIATIVGARPQFIKAAPLSLALQRAGIDEAVIHTGQHYDVSMSDIFFDELGIPAPKYHLGIGSGPHGEQTGRMMEALEKVFVKDRPRCVLIYGDTNSTLAGALVASKLHIPVAHVEAGLRSFNRRMPEEINRVVADHLSAVLFAPTDIAVANLAKEGIAGHLVHKTGDVMLDAAKLFGKAAVGKSTALKQNGLAEGRYILATVHRAENTDDPNRLAVIMQSLTTAARDMPVVLPLHPRTKSKLDAGQRDAFMAAGGKLIEPVGFLDMITLEQHAALIVTDSGGVQKEAFFYQVPCVTLRDETEWVELVDLGWNRLSPPLSAEAVTKAIRASLGSRGQPSAPYGDGNAAGEIAAVLSRGIA